MTGKDAEVFDVKLFRRLEEELDELPVRRALAQQERDVHRFNILNVLGLSNYEIRHSFMLAWLLDPEGTHGLGDFFLKAFVERVVSANSDRDYGWLRDFCGENEMIRVSREMDDIDLLLVSETRKMVLVVENKWDAAEREDSEDQVGQLRKYYNNITSCYPPEGGWRTCFVFLSPTGRAPSEVNRETWGVLSYKDVLVGLNAILDDPVVGEKIEDGVEILVRHYAEIVERKVNMENQEFKDQCEALYRKYQDVIDYIVAHVDTRSPVLAKIAEGVDVEIGGVQERLKCDSDSQRYVQFKRRFPNDSSSSVHYEVLCPKGAAKAVVSFHIEADTDARIKGALSSEMKTVVMPSGFRKKGGGKVEKEISLAGKSIDEVYAEVLLALRGLYAACEPILREFEGRGNSEIVNPDK